MWLIAVTAGKRVVPVAAMERVVVVARPVAGRQRVILVPAWPVLPAAAGFLGQPIAAVHTGRRLVTVAAPVLLAVTGGAAGAAFVRIDRPGLLMPPVRSGAPVPLRVRCGGGRKSWVGVAGVRLGPQVVAGDVVPLRPAVVARGVVAVFVVARGMTDVVPGPALLARHAVQFGGPRVVVRATGFPDVAVGPVLQRFDHPGQVGHRQPERPGAGAALPDAEHGHPRVRVPAQPHTA